MLATAIGIAAAANTVGPGNGTYGGYSSHYWGAYVLDTTDGTLYGYCVDPGQASPDNPAITNDTYTVSTVSNASEATLGWLAAQTGSGALGLSADNLAGGISMVAYNTYGGGSIDSGPVSAASISAVTNFIDNYPGTWTISATLQAAPAGGYVAGRTYTGEVHVAAGNGNGVPDVQILSPAVGGAGEFSSFAWTNATTGGGGNASFRWTDDNAGDSFSASFTSRYGLPTGVADLGRAPAGSGGQTMLLGITRSNASATVNGTTASSTTVSPVVTVYLVKVASGDVTDTPIAGAVFNITSASGTVLYTGVTTQTTPVEIDALVQPAGMTADTVYEVIETQAPSGYTIPANNVTNFTTPSAGGTMTVTVADPVSTVTPPPPPPNTASVDMVKTSSTDPTDTPIAGAVFNLADGSGNILATGITSTTSPVEIDQLVSGGMTDGSTYELIETAAPAGYYIAANNVTTFTIPAGATTDEIIVADAPVPSPTVATQVTSDSGLPGTVLSDVVTVSGDDGEAGVIVGTLYGPVAPSATGSCGDLTLAQWEAGATQTFTTDITGNGIYTITGPTSASAGCYGWSDTITLTPSSTTGSSSPTSPAESTAITVPVYFVKASSTDPTDTSVAGAVFSLADASGNILATGITSATTPVEIDQLVSGGMPEGATYELIETQAPPGYYVPTGNVTTFTVPMDATAYTVLSMAATTSIAPSPNNGVRPTGQLFAVSCPIATTCIAVGIDNSQQVATSIGTLSGGTWTWSAETQAGNGYGDLTAASCPSATSCVAVGFNSNRNNITIAGTLSGGVWTWSAESLVPGQSSQGELAGVSCPTTTTCVAVGYESRNNTYQSITTVGTLSGGAWTWTAQSVVTPDATGYGRLNAVSCPSATSCVAVGYDGSLQSGSNQSITTVGALSGGAWIWTTESPVSADASGAGYLYGVSCPTATTCVAVGFDAGAQSITTVGALSGGSWTWTADTVITPDSFGFGDLYGVSCFSATTCVAVGQDSYDPIATVGTLSGGTWTWSAESSAVGDPTTGTGYDRGVGCASATTCVAVGYDRAFGGIANVMELPQGPVTAPTAAYTVTVTDPPMPTPALSTQVGAPVVSVATTALTDTVTVSGNDGEAGTITATLYGPVAVPSSMSCVDVTLVQWEASASQSYSVAITGDGPVVITGVVPNSTGCYAWAESLTLTPSNAVATSLPTVPTESSLVTIPVSFVKASTTDPTDAPVAGAVFTLESSSGVVLATGLTSGTSAVAINVPGLYFMQGATYELVEVTAPAGYYVPTNNVTTFTIPSGVTTDTALVLDPPMPTPSLSSQVSASDQAPGTRLTDSVVVSGDDSESGLIQATLYGPVTPPASMRCSDLTLAEFEASPSQVITVAIGANGTYSVTGPEESATGCYAWAESLTLDPSGAGASSSPLVVSEQTLIAVPVTFTKASTTDPTGTPIAGAVFNLADANGNILATGLVSGTNAVTINVPGLHFMQGATYELIETREPRGYYIAGSNVITFTIPAGATAYSVLATDPPVPLLTPASVVSQIRTKYLTPGGGVADSIDVAVDDGEPGTITGTLYGPVAPPASMSCADLTLAQWRVASSQVFTAVLGADGTGTVLGPVPTQAGCYGWAETVTLTASGATTTTPPTSTNEQAFASVSGSGKGVGGTGTGHSTTNINTGGPVSEGLNKTLLSSGLALIALAVLLVDIGRKRRSARG
jgi:hypothetical protein